LLHSIAEHL